MDSSQKSARRVESNWLQFLQKTKPITKQAKEFDKTPIAIKVSDESLKGSRLNDNEQEFIKILPGMVVYKCGI